SIQSYSTPCCENTDFARWQSEQVGVPYIVIGVVISLFWLRFAEHPRVTRLVSWPASRLAPRWSTIGERLTSIEPGAWAQADTVEPSVDRQERPCPPSPTRCRASTPRSPPCSSRSSTGSAP